ncbi:MAG: hypothetical protein KDA62_12075 [Planctomycetales bacterium]|nr:hypothetical protein [Planctomycetales bacterium]
MHALLVSLVIAQTPIVPAGPPALSPSALAPRPAVVAPDTVLVAPQAFMSALQPWIQYRTAQGHRILYVTNRQSAESIRREIRMAARGGQLKYVLLVGDVAPEGVDDREVLDRCTPTHLAEAQVNVHWGSEPKIATDNWYADLDNDQIPDLAIGRLPADSPEELSAMIQKTLAYESSLNFGMWRQRINFVAGVGGFGPLVDSLLEMTTSKFLTDGIPSSFDTTMTYGSWRSPYCPDPRKFHQHTVGRLNEGCLFWVYIGHGQRTFLDRVHTPGGQHHILSTADVAKLQCDDGPPIAMFLACYTGAFDYTRDCLAEEMLRSEGGPVAVYSGSRVTMPYAMAVMGTAMMDECFQRQRPTLGEIILHAKRQMTAEVEAAEVDGAGSSGTNSDPDEANESESADAKRLAQRQLLDSLAKAISPAPDALAAERMEHVLLFNLLGDPLLRVRHPDAVDVATATSATAGERLRVACRSPLAGKCTVELVCRRDRTRQPAPARGAFQPAPAWLESFDQVYRAANDRRWTVQEIDATPGDFQLDLEIPDEARGPCNVRLFVAGKESFAVGAADVYVKRRRTQ